VENLPPSPSAGGRMDIPLFTGEKCEFIFPFILFLFWKPPLSSPPGPALGGKPKNEIPETSGFNNSIFQSVKGANRFSVKVDATCIRYAARSLHPLVQFNSPVLCVPLPGVFHWHFWPPTSLRQVANKSWQGLFLVNNSFDSLIIFKN